MRLAYDHQNLTLVLAALLAGLALSADKSYGAPTTPVPKSALTQQQTVTPTPAGHRQIDQKESLDPGLASDLSVRNFAPVRGPEIFPTRVIRSQSRVLGLGVISGSIEESSPRTMTWASLTFQNDNQNETGQSYGLGLAAKDTWGLHWDMHQYCCLGEKAEPYWGLGIGSFYQTSDRLAAIVNFERYHLRARVGFEDLFSLKRRLRAEFILRVSPLGASGQIGVAWTWSADEFLF